MEWEVEFHEQFAEEFLEFTAGVQDALLAKVGLLEEYGPKLGRPHVDTLYESKYGNMKELRFTALLMQKTLYPLTDKAFR